MPSNKSISVRLLSANRRRDGTLAATTETTWFETAGGSPLTLSGTNGAGSEWTETVYVKSTTMTEAPETVTIPPVAWSGETFQPLTVTLLEEISSS
jgi:hypothetical protein